MYKVTNASKGTPSSRGLIYKPLSSKDFIFSQASIVSSVQLEPNSHLIHPKTSSFVNSNGDTWSNESLRANYLSFQGAFNYINHQQEPDKSVGFIADAALRKIKVPADDEVFVYYVDILVATSRSHKISNLILDGSVEFLSMGCESMCSRCSRCGERYSITEASNGGWDCSGSCDCLYSQKGKYFLDVKGVQRIVADVLGDESHGSCEFIEASWLTQPPAFDGACRRNTLAIPEGKVVMVGFSEESLERPAVKMWVK